MKRANLINFLALSADELIVDAEFKDGEMDSCASP